MSHLLLDVRHIDETPRSYLDRVASVFAVWDATTNDSGNVSYGVTAGTERFFVKTAGEPDAPLADPHSPDWEARVALLRNAATLHGSCDHEALAPLRAVIESPVGPMLVFGWVEGESLGGHGSHRQLPDSAHQRFRRLPAEQALCALDGIYDLHAELEGCGWVAVDLYDNSLIYDFCHSVIHVIDLDMYHRGPFVNEMGRFFGSSRFMAPEEFVKGATIDARTTVFTMGCTARVFLCEDPKRGLGFRGGEALREVVLRACEDSPSDRYQSVGAFFDAWRSARER